METISQVNQEPLFCIGYDEISIASCHEREGDFGETCGSYSGCCTDIGRCGLYTQFASHDRLLESIGVLYVDVLNLLVRAIRFYEK